MPTADKIGNIVEKILHMASSSPFTYDRVICRPKPLVNTMVSSGVKAIIDKINGKILYSSGDIRLSRNCCNQIRIMVLAISETALLMVLTMTVFLFVPVLSFTICPLYFLFSSLYRYMFWIMT